MFSLLIFLGVAGYVLGIAAFLLALQLWSRSQRLQTKVADLEEAQRLLDHEVERLAATGGRKTTAKVAEGQVPAATAAKKTAKEPVRSAPVAADAAAAQPASAKTSSKISAAKAAETASLEAPAAPAAALPRQVGLEERLGTRWAVWVGGVALALGALLLVRYSIEEGLLGPGVRVLLGAALSAALVAGGEWLRRGEGKLNTDLIPAAHIPSVLTAAGTVAAFGTVYAAHALYGFIGPGLAFVLLGAIALATLAAAMMHGPALAGLGLAGSYVAPMLVSSSTPNPWPLVIYLAVVTAAAYALAAMKNWRWLESAAAVGAALWGFVLAGEAADDRAWLAPAMAHALLQLGLAVYALAFVNEARVSNSQIRAPDYHASGIFAALAAVAVAVIVANQGVSPASVMFTAASIAMLMVAGLRAVPAAHAVGLAGAVALAKMMAWPSIAGSRLDPLLPEYGAAFTEPLNANGFASLSVLAALVIAGLCGQKLLVSPRLRTWTAAVYAGTATLVPLLALIIAYLRMTGYAPSPYFALAGLALALFFAVGVALYEAREKDADTPAIRLGTGAFASAAALAAALALTFYLERGYLTVALALGAYATAVMADRKAIAMLRKVVVALGLIVLARIVYDPRIMGESVGAMPIFNWLLLGYGVPAASFYGAARILERTGDDTAKRLSDALGVLFAGLLAFFQIRHLLHDGQVLATATDHTELGLMLVVAAGFAYALMHSGVLRNNPVFKLASFGFGAVAAAGTVVGLLFAENPYFNGDLVKSFGPFDTLWLGYLAPAAGAALLSRQARGEWPKLLVLAAAGLALALAFTFVTLEVRHAYQGASVAYWHATSQAEFWSYSAVWLLLGIGLLGYGLWREMPEARLASAALVVLTVLKVFLVDLSGLTGAWRAFSFIGLGAVLVGIGLFYQRWVFNKQRTEPSQT